MAHSLSLGFDDLACFVAVTEHGSFTAAAAALGLRKATVSRHVRQLEERLGAQLLLRTTRAVRLTEEGRVYLEQAHPAVRLARDARRALHDARAHPAGVLRLTTVPYFGDVILGPLLIEYLAAHPDVSLELDLRSEPVDLVGEHVDVAIRFGTLKDSTLLCRRIGQARIVCVAAPAYLARRGGPKQPAELSGHDTIAMGSGKAPAIWNFRRAGRSVAVSLAPRLRSASHLLHLRAVEAGLGIARLPEPVVRESLAQGRTVMLLPDWSTTDIPISLLMPRRTPLPARTRAFVDHLAAAVDSGRLAALMTAPGRAPKPRR